MMFPKPVIEKKKPKPIRSASQKVPSVIEYQNMSYPKPPTTKKRPKPIVSRRKSYKKKTSPINGHFCFVCGCTVELQDHHIFFGEKWRDLSEFYGLKLFLCKEHHLGNSGAHRNRKLDLELKQFGQIWFNKHYPDLNFIEIFGRNYL